MNSFKINIGGLRMAVKKVSGRPREITEHSLMAATSVDKFVELYFTSVLPRRVRQKASRRWAKKHKVKPSVLKLALRNHPLYKQKMSAHREYLVQLTGGKGSYNRWDDNIRRAFTEIVTKDYSSIEMAQALHVSYYSVLYNRHKYNLANRICTITKSKPTQTKIVGLMSFSAIYLTKCINYSDTHTINFIDILYKDMPFVKYKSR